MSRTSKPREIKYREMTNPLWSQQRCSHAFLERLKHIQMREERRRKETVKNEKPYHQDAEEVRSSTATPTKATSSCQFAGDVLCGSKAQVRRIPWGWYVSCCFSAQELHPAPCQLRHPTLETITKLGERPWLVASVALKRETNSIVGVVIV